MSIKEAIAILNAEADLQARRVTYCRMPKSTRAYKVTKALERAIEALKQVEVKDA